MKIQKQQQIIRGVFRIQSKIRDRAFCEKSQKIILALAIYAESTLPEARQGSEYTSETFY